ncbi:hypothetical protein ACJA28_01725 [Mesomycoplasma moatsii]|uniref:LacI family DNA-binding transcriptional regulator n=1 Tax=Mesomycoplasma moatsii TaxID=171287 RepID=UPI0003B50FE3
MSNKKEKEEKITYHNIKRATNLSIGTISRYFNNGSISSKARKEIEKYIKKTNYKPNIGAKLIKGYDNSVYLVVCNIKELAILDIVSAITNCFKLKGINVYVVISSYDHDEYFESLKKTINRKPKTLILLTPIMSDKLRNYINSINIDTYVYGDDTTNKPTISIDEKKMMYDLTSLIIKNNKFKKIIYIGKNETDYTTGKLRYEGFKKSIIQSTIDYEKYLIENNTVNDIEKLVKKIKHKLKDPNLIIICGTHTIFKYLIFEKYINRFRYELTDIGYTNEYDYIDNTYKYKIFIDFYKIGYLLYKFKNNKIQQNTVINNFLIIEK